MINIFNPTATPTADVHQTVAAVVNPCDVPKLLLRYIIPAPRKPTPVIMFAIILEAAPVSLIICVAMAVNNVAPMQTAA